MNSERKIFLVKKTHFLKEDKLRWWGDGPWIEEPDEIDFHYKQIHCKILRQGQQGYPEVLSKLPTNFGGFLCGYVKIPEGHKLYGKEDIFDTGLDVHGGITFAQVPIWDKGFWLGFDAAHGGDIIPCMKQICETDTDLKAIKEKCEKLRKQYGIEKYTIAAEQYRTTDFMIFECKSLVDQILEIK